MYLARLLTMIKFAIIIMTLSGINPFPILGIPTPNWYQFFVNSKIYAILMTFFIGNFIETQLVSTGAFEVSLNDVPVWSKLESGRLPKPAELFQMIENQLRVTSYNM